MAQASEQSGTTASQTGNGTVTWRWVAGTALVLAVSFGGYAWQSTVKTVAENAALTRELTNRVTQNEKELTNRVSQIEKDFAIQQAVTNIQLAEIKAKLDEALRK